MLAARRSSPFLLGVAALALGRPAGGAPAAGEAVASGWAERAFERYSAELVKRAGRPEAIAPLAALVDLEDHLAPGRIDPVLGAIVDDARADPLVAAQAAHRLALLEARRGDLEGARRRTERLGLIGQFRVIGPFDAQGRSGLERSFPPEERGADPHKPDRYPGKEREVGWRVAQGALRDGALSLDALLRPDADAVAYALTWVRSERRQAAVVRAGSPGPLKIWVAGRPVLERNVVREAGPDQDAARVTLEAGESAVLIKTVVTAGQWRLFVRFTDEAGRPLAGLTASADGSAPLFPAAPPAAEPRSKGEPRALGTLLRLRAERARGKDRAEAWLDYARWLAFGRAEDREAKALEAALGKAIDAGAGAEAQLLLGARAQEEDDRRRALEAAAAGAKDPGLAAQALAALGDIARGHQRASEAASRWRAALVADPACVPAVLALAAEEQLAGLGAAALARLQTLPAPARALARVRLQRVRTLDGLGRRKEAEAELRALYETRRMDPDVALDLARSARNRGDLGESIRLHEEIARARPDMSFVTIEWAQLLAGKGDVAGARRVLEEAAERLPDEAALHEELGRLLVRAGQGPAGLLRLQAALRLRPQNPQLRRYVERLGAEATGARADAADDLARLHAEDGERLAREVLMPPASDKRPPDRNGALVVLDKQVVRVHRNGLSERFVQRLVHVRTEQAAREQQEFYVRYTPGAHDVEIRRAQVYRKSAAGQIEVSEANARDDRDMSEPWYGLYYDNRAEVVVFEGLKPGDVLEVQYTLADVSPENALSDYFGDIDFVAETIPKRRWEYVLIAPAERSFFFNQPRVAGLERKEERRGGEVIHRFSAKDIGRVETEPSMPGWAEVSPYLHVSTYKSWQDVGRWYWHLVADQLAADETLRRAAREATAGAHTLEDKVRALHRFVLESTRYVGLEFGIHGYKPYKVTQILSRRFGDCKDKASLLSALLREVGVESELVLLRTRRGGRVDTSPASLAVFDHAIVYVPALSLYLDGTAEFSGMGELPFEDQGVMVLRVSARTATLAETPVLPSSANRALRRWTVDLEASGAARVEEVVTISGQAAPEWREHYQTPGERRERFGKVWNGRFPGATLESLQMDGVEDRNRPVIARSLASVPRLADAAGPGTLRLTASAREVDFVRSYARLSARKHELLVAYPWQHEEELLYRVPAGWHVVGLPEAKHAESGFGRFRLEISTDKAGREVKVHSVVDVVKNRIAPADYAAFRNFLGAIDGAFGQTIVIRRDEG
jgi:transglutaminase-like putative cysteine protease